MSQMEESHPDLEGTCECVKQTAAERRQGMLDHRKNVGCYKLPQSPLPEFFPGYRPVKQY
jgi:hypothetical protein